VTQLISIRENLMQGFEPAAVRSAVDHSTGPSGPLRKKEKLSILALLIFHFLISPIIFQSAPHFSSLFPVAFLWKVSEAGY
jgi:hypothetical protein